jgi:YidC/Oxa1 family membrane protein insertase
MKELYNFLIYNPLLNILIFFYNTIAFKDLGLAIIFLTILTRLIFYPFSQKMIETQLLLQKIQPEIKEIQKKYKSEPQKQVEETMNLYKKYKINPFSIYIFLIIQLPILIALYQIFSQNFNGSILKNLYFFINKPEFITQTFLGLINLEKPSIILAVVAAFFQYLQTMISMNVFPQKNATTKFLGYLGPAITMIFISYLPGAIGLYWSASNLISLIQQVFINKKIQKNELGGIYK